MPNWCENDLYIEGPAIQTVLKAIAADDGTSAIDFKKILPMPTDLDITSPPHSEEEKAKAAENTKKYGAPTWYEWSVQNWGTKWNAGSEAALEYAKGRRAKIRFDTAWAPPIPVIRKLGSMFPDHAFKLCYFEQGGGFSGRFIIKKTLVVEDSLNNAYHGHRGG